MKNKMKEYNPKVSIIIPVYNGSNYLKDSINSALNQTYKNIEILVVNDGSKDDGKTEKIAKAYGNKIKYFEKENGGVASALNYAIEKATGDYVSWLSHDDMYHKDKILEEVNAISTKKEIIICNVTLIDKNGKKIEDCHIPKNMFNKSIKTFLAANPYFAVNGCAMLIPKSIFKEYGIFNENLKYTQDYDLWFRFASKGIKFNLLEKNLMLSRQHDNQDSRKYNHECTIAADSLHEEFLKKIDCSEFYNAFKNLNEIEEYFKVYLANNYVKTAAYIMKLCCEYLIKNELYDDFKKLVSKYVYYSENIDEIIIPQKNNKNTIMFYSNAWTKGGVERVLSIIMPKLTDKYNIFLVNGSILSDDAYPLPSEINHITLGKNTDDKIDYIILVLSLIYNIDIFVGNPNIIEKFLDSYSLLKEVGVRTVAINHYYYFLPFTIEWMYPIISKRNTALENVDVSVWLTDFSLSAYSAMHKNGVVIGNPTTFPIQKNIKNKEENVILCVGRFYDAVKRIDRIFKIFKNVLNEKPNSKLWLVGDYDLDFKHPILDNMTLKDYYEKFNFPKDSVFFWGRQDKMEDFYKKANVYLLTSESEGFSLSTLEAISCGLPCVAGKINGLDGLIENNINAYICEQDDYKSLALSIVKLFNDKKVSSEFSKNSYLKAEKYDTDKVVEKYVEIFDILLLDNYQEVLNKKVFKNNILLNNEIIKEYEKYIPKIIDEYKKIINIKNDEIRELTSKIDNNSVIYNERPIKDEFKYLGKRVIKGIGRRMKIKK